MPNHADLARGWMLKGDSDRAAAERILQGPGAYDTACFHCQQAAEKYLKAVLAMAGQPIPRMHDLEDVYDLCLAVAPALVLAPTGNLTPHQLVR